MKRETAGRLQLAADYAEARQQLQRSWWRVQLGPAAATEGDVVAAPPSLRFGHHSTTSAALEHCSASSWVQVENKIKISFSISTFLFLFISFYLSSSEILGTA